MSPKEKQLQERKTRLIKRYMHLQDCADAYNEKIYGACCDIERVNLEIEAEQRRAAAAKHNGQAAATGSSRAVVGGMKAAPGGLKAAILNKPRAISG